MNKAQAIKLVKEQGGTVSKENKFESRRDDFPGAVREGKEFFVNGVRVWHDGFGGSGCWQVADHGRKTYHWCVTDCILSVIGIAAMGGQVIAQSRV